MASHSFANVLGWIVLVVVLGAAVYFGPLGQFGKPQPEAVAPAAQPTGAPGWQCPARPEVRFVRRDGAPAHVQTASKEAARVPSGSGPVNASAVRGVSSEPEK